MQALATAPDPAPLAGSLPAPPAWLVEECRILEPPPADERRHVLREEAALLLDRLLVRVARSRGALDVAIGEALATLSLGDRTLRLGYSGIGDYALQRLDLAPRTAQDMARLARALRSRPLLRAAVLRGDVTARKALSVLPLAVGDAEAEWVDRARGATVRTLVAEVRSRSGAAEVDGEDGERWERIDASLPAGGREVVDRALALAGELLGASSAKWRRVEALCQEFLGAHPVEPSDDDLAGDPIARAESAAIEEALEREFDEWRWLDELHANAPDGRGPGGPVQAPVPDLADGSGADVFRLDADLRRLARMRARWDALLGHLAMLLGWCGVWREMKFASFAHYCSERLGMSGRAVAQRAALQRKLHALPALREAFRSGSLGYEQARLVAAVASEKSEAGWIAQAERSTCVALRRLVYAAEEAQMCAPRETTLRVPAEVAALVRAAFRAAREAEGRWLTPGECLVRVAAHYLDTYGTAPPARRTRSTKALARDGGLCQVPGCSRTAVHAHHIVFRSAGGGDEETNLVSLCAGHHLHGVHAGWIRVRGAAPLGLVWKLGLRPDGTWLEVHEGSPAH